MKLLHTSKYYNFICMFLSILLLMAEMCFGNAETNSFFACAQFYKHAATLEATNATIENVEVCNLETLEKQDTQVSLSNGRRAGKSVSKEFAAVPVADMMLQHDNESMGRENTSFWAKCSSHIAILDYIHNQDGEKWSPAYLH